MTWEQFKEYWNNKNPGGWIFDDLNKVKAEQFKKMMAIAWANVGPKFCTEKNMNYVQINQGSVQKSHASSMGKTHFIFAIDGSGSMDGTPWSQAITAFSKSIDDLKKLPQSEENIRVTTMVFDHNCSISEERKKAS